MNDASGIASVRREGNRIWIDGIPRLEWGKSGETTFCGALSAALAPSDRPRDYATLMGDSAVAFRVRWYRGKPPRRWTGAAPVAEQVEERTRIGAALGVPVEVLWCYSNSPQRPQAIERIVVSIEAGRPVLAYLSPALDMAVVYGYADGGNTVLVRDYYDKPDADPAHPSSQLGGFFLFLGAAISAPMSPRNACHAALRAAINNWTRTDRPRFDEEGEFAYGEPAYDEWIEDVRSAGDLSDNDRKSLFDISNWVLNSLNDARLNAAKYLRASAIHLDAGHRAAIERVAALYDRLVHATGGPTWGEKAVFFGPWSPKTVADWTPEIRERETRILGEARDLDREAMSILRAVVSPHEFSR